MKNICAPFNPITGEGSVGERFKYTICDYPTPMQYLPVEMKNEPFVKKLKKAGSVARLVEGVLHGGEGVFGDLVETACQGLFRTDDVAESLEFLHVLYQDFIAEGVAGFIVGIGAEEDDAADNHRSVHVSVLAEDDFVDDGADLCAER